MHALSLSGAGCRLDSRAGVRVPGEGPEEWCIVPGRARPSTAQRGMGRPESPDKLTLPRRPVAGDRQLGHTGELNANRRPECILCRPFLRKGVSFGFVGRNQNLKDLKAIRTGRDLATMQAGPGRERKSRLKTATELKTLCRLSGHSTRNVLPKLDATW